MEFILGEPFREESGHVGNSWKMFQKAEAYGLGDFIVVRGNGPPGEIDEAIHEIKVIRFERLLEGEEEIHPKACVVFTALNFMLELGEVFDCFSTPCAHGLSAA